MIIFIKIVNLFFKYCYAMLTSDLNPYTLCMGVINELVLPKEK